MKWFNLAVKAGLVVSFLIAVVWEPDVVEGKNMVWKHLRKSEQNPQGGRVQREAPIPIANVMLWNAKAGKPERVHYKRQDGKKIRYFKSTNTAIDE